jgi:hypothetical protein
MKDDFYNDPDCDGLTPNEKAKICIPLTLFGIIMSFVMIRMATPNWGSLGISISMGILSFFGLIYNISVLIKSSKS